MQTKILPLKELAVTIAGLKAKGKKIAMAHGCFDLLHPGHFKHLEAAKKASDILIVTITPDRFVNKGPGRPLFNEQIRAETIAALSAVDFVGINQWDTAIETIKLLKPDLYVKGQDYKDASKDITGNISLEEEAVKSVGGRMYITEEITFSSSKLINANFNPFGDEKQKYLNGLKERFDAGYIISEIDKLKDVKVLVIGDTIIDEYHTCVPLGKSSKAPTISTKFLKSEAYAGGVLAIANHLEQFAGKVELITCLGKQDSQIDIVEKKLSAGIEKKIFWRDDGPTPTKRRYLDKYLNIKLFEVTFMNDKHISESLESEIVGYLQTKIKDYDMVVIADFGHGFISPGIIKYLEDCGVYLAVNAQTNSNNYGFNYITKYNRADYISIDEKELRLPFGDNYGRLESLIYTLRDIAHCKNIQITLGQQGSITYKDDKFIETPAFATAVKDSVGAGDAVLSITALLSFTKAANEIVPFVGNCVGSLAVEIIGNEHPVYKKDLVKFISHFLK